MGSFLQKNTNKERAKFMKKSTLKRFAALALVVMMLVTTCISYTASAAKVNYAQGKSYTVTGSFLGGKADNGVMLTDGTMAVVETAGQTAVFVGTGYTNTIVVDLGAVYTDINEIVVGGVIVVSNRAYGNVVIEVSANGVDFVAVTDYVVTDTLVEGSEVAHNYSYALASNVSAKFVKISVTQDLYCFGLSEVQVYGGDAADDTTSDAADDTTSDAADDTTSDAADDTTSDAADDTTSDAADDTTSDAADDTTSDASDDTTSDAADDTTSDAADDTTSDEPAAPVEVNYAAGKSYTVEGAFLAGKEDNGTCLTDGAVTAESAGQAVAFMGTGKANVVNVNLGKKYTDITRLEIGTYVNGNRKFGTVTVEVNTGSGFKTISADKYTITEVDLGGNVYNKVVTFNEAISAKAVKVTVVSDDYVLVISELKVIGNGGEASVNPDNSDSPGDAGVAVVAILTVISLAGAVVVSKRRRA